MKQLAILILFFILITSFVQAQVNISAKVGYGFYSMKDLKSFQEARLNEMTEIPAQIVDEFPPYINYKLFLSFPRDNDRTKLRYYLGFQTTGSRISLTDYSGKLTFDMIVNGYTAGVEFEPFSTVVLKVINIQGYICFGTTTTFLKLEDYLEIGEEKLEESYLFCSHGLDIEPGLKAGYKYKRLGFGLTLGYLQDINMTFYMKGSPKTKLGSSSFKTVHPNWAGLRTGIEISVDLFNKSK